MNQFRMLAVAPSTRGFGFVVMDGEKTLVDWGGKRADGDINAVSIAKLTKLLDSSQPDVLVLQDVTVKGSRRVPRIKTLYRQMIKLAGKRKLKVVVFSGTQLRTLLLGNPKGTRQEMAEHIANRFPDELASQLPPKRCAWMNEDGRMDIFDAVALALAFWLKKK